MPARPTPAMPELSASAHGLRTAAALRELQARLCERIAAADGAMDGAMDSATDGGARFGRDEWSREEGGGGIARVLAEGAVFEKAGVLYSGINGRDIPPVVLQEHPEVQPGTPYVATGVSLILHPRNPYVPTVHFNVRYFEVGHVYWYGGGMDLTPYYPFREDCIHFHRTIRASCERFDPGYYARFKPWCDRYFYLKHRAEPRGIGGIFFNYLHDDLAGGLEFILALGECFAEAYLPIVARRRETPYGERERAFQALRRGRYVEFNLMYDQGTLFGLQSGGRTESILVSLPPHVQWRYDWRPEPGSPEEALLRDFLPPRDWAALEF
jgi:coproporphyrinogen III oxidase